MKINVDLFMKSEYKYLAAVISEFGDTKSIHIWVDKHGPGQVEKLRVVPLGKLKTKPKENNTIFMYEIDNQSTWQTNPRFKATLFLNFEWLGD
jgi:hypothetical protein